VRVAVEHEGDERPAGAHERARELDQLRVHRMHVAPLGDLEHVVEPQDRDVAVLIAADARAAGDELEQCGLDVGDAVLEHLGEEAPGSVFVSHVFDPQEVRGQEGGRRPAHRAVDAGRVEVTAMDRT
jgi:hypothetical protein